MPCTPAYAKIALYESLIGRTSGRASGELALYTLPQRLGSDLGERRQQVVDDAAGVGSDFNGDGHTRGQRDGRVVDFHRGFVERHGHAGKTGNFPGLTGGSGAPLEPRWRSRWRWRRRALGVLLGDGCAEAMLTTSPCSAPKRVKGKSVDLDHRLLAGLDEADIEIGHERLDLEACRRSASGQQELLAGGDDLADRGDGHLLDHAVPLAHKAGCERGARPLSQAPDALRPPCAPRQRVCSRCRL